MSHLNLNQLAWRTWRTFFFKQACLAGTFSQDHPALILNFKSLAFNPLSWPGTLHHLFWGFVITESTCRVLQHFKLSVDKNQNNYNFHKLKTAIQTLQPHLTPIFHNKSLQREGFSCTRAFCSFCHRTSRWAARKTTATRRRVTPAPRSLLPAGSVPRTLCQPAGCEKLCSMVPQVGQSEEEEENGLCRQLNRSERWWQGGMAIPARTCPYHAGNVSHPKGIPTTCLGGYKRFSAALGKQKIY